MRSTGLLKWMIIEVILCSLHSPTFLDLVIYLPNARNEIPYSLDMILTFFPLMRFYLLWRVFIGGSFWADQNAEHVCREVCNTHGSAIFVLKCEMKERPFTVILFTLIILIFVFGFAVRAAEL